MTATTAATAIARATTSPEAPSESYSYFSQPSAPKGDTASAEAVTSRPATPVAPAGPAAEAELSASTTDASAPSGDEAVGGDAPPQRTRRSRDRYGRDRRERNGQPRTATGGEGSDEDTGATPSDAEAPAEVVVAPSVASLVTPVPTAPTAEPVPAPATAPVAAPTPEVAAEAAASTPAPALVEASVAAVEAPVVNVAPAQAAVGYSLPVSDLQAMVAQVGLDWVNSDHGKVAQVQALIAAEPKPIHVPRESKAVTLSDEGPLILVETRRDLGAMTLPFDQPRT